MEPSIKIQDNSPNHYSCKQVSHGGAHRCALNRNTEMRYRIGDFGVFLFFTKSAQNGVNGVNIGRISAEFRCTSFVCR